MTNNNEWIIIFWSIFDHRQWTPTRVHREAGLTDKEFGDAVALIAQDRPTVIYTWVREQDYYDMHRDSYLPKGA